MISIDRDRLEKILERIRSLPLSSSPFSFSPALGQEKEAKEIEFYPPSNAPGVLDFFFAVTMHQFGFWYGSNEGYLEPIYGTMQGHRVKGSDWLWSASLKIYRTKGPWFFDPRHLASLSTTEARQWFADDEGPVPLPDFEQRLAITKDFGRTMHESCCWTPETILNLINKGEKPLWNFLLLTRRLPGYDCDPFFKKNTLLAMILTHRPEKFLQPAHNEQWPPIVDYHLVRLALRLGLVKLSGSEYTRNRNRLWVSREMEYRIRHSVFDALLEIIQQSGKSMHAVDKIMWHARAYCSEMTVPHCHNCALQDACEKHITMFQPIYRTMNH